MNGFSRVRICNARRGLHLTYMLLRYGLCTHFKTDFITTVSFMLWCESGTYICSYNFGFV